MPGMGSNAILSICRQNSMGATAPSSWYAIPFANNGLAFTYGELTDDSIQQTPDLPDRAIGIGGFQGNIESNLFPLPVGFFLRGLFGVVSASALGSGFVHTFNPATAAWSPECQLAPYAFQVDPGEPSVNSAYLHTDGFINTGEITITAAGYARASFGVLGKSIGLITKAPGASINQTGAAPLLWSGASISFGGTAVQRFSNVKLAFDNKVAAQDRITGVKQHAFFFRDGFRDFGRFSGTIDLAQTDWLDFYNGTEKRMVISMLGVTSISSGVNELLTIDIPRMIYTAYPLNVSGAGIVTAAVEGRAMYSAASKTVCTITLVNTFASYAA